MKWYALVVNRRQENISAKLSDPPVGASVIFLHGKNPLRLLGLGLALASLAGCSRTRGSKVFLDIPDLLKRKEARETSCQ